MEALNHALAHPEYLHILLNHLPLTALAVALAFLVISLVLNNRPGIFTALALAALLAGSVYPVMQTGDKAYSKIKKQCDEQGARHLRQHMDLAEDWAKLYYAAGGAALLSLVLGWKYPKCLRPAAGLAALLLAGSLAVGGKIAETGGKARHPEFRFDAPAKTEDEGK